MTNPVDAPLFSSFSTDRISITNWRSTVSDPDKRDRLVGDLAGVLTPSVTAPLPPSFQFEPTAKAISQWITRQGEDGET